MTQSQTLSLTLSPYSSAQSGVNNGVYYFGGANANGTGSTQIDGDMQQLMSDLFLSEANTMLQGGGGTRTLTMTKKVTKGGDDQSNPFTGPDPYGLFDPQGPRKAVRESLGIPLQSDQTSEELQLTVKVSGDGTQNDQDVQSVFDSLTGKSTSGTSGMTGMTGIQSLLAALIGNGTSGTSGMPGIQSLLAALTGNGTTGMQGIQSLYVALTSNNTSGSASTSNTPNIQSLFNELIAKNNLNGGSLQSILNSLSGKTNPTSQDLVVAFEQRAGATPADLQSLYEKLMGQRVGMGEVPLNNFRGGSSVQNAGYQTCTASGNNAATVAESCMGDSAASLMATQKLKMDRGVDTTLCCANFASAALVQAGEIPASQHTDSVSTLASELIGDGSHYESRSQVKPGDVAIVNGGEHVEIVKSVNADGTITLVGSNNTQHGHGPQVVSEDNYEGNLGDARFISAPPKKRSNYDLAA